MKIVGQMSLKKLKEGLHEMGHKITTANGTSPATASFIPQALEMQTFRTLSLESPSFCVLSS